MNEPSPLQMAIELAERDYEQSIEGEHDICILPVETTAELISAAKQLETVTKERDDLKARIQLMEYGKYGRIDMHLQFLATQTELRVCVEALKQCFTYLGFEIKRKSLNESAADGTQKLSREIAGLLDNHLTAALLKKKK